MARRLLRVCGWYAVRCVDALHGMCAGMADAMQIGGTESAAEWAIIGHQDDGIGGRALVRLP